MVSWVPHSSTSNLSWWDFSCEFPYHFKADGLLLKLKKTHSWLQAGNTFRHEFTVWAAGKALLMSSFLYEKDTSPSAVHIPFISLGITLSLPTWRQSAHTPILSSDGLQSLACLHLSPYKVSFVIHSGLFLLPDKPSLDVPLIFADFQLEDPGTYKDTRQPKSKNNAARTENK